MAVPRDSIPRGRLEHQDAVPTPRINSKPLHIQRIRIYYQRREPGKYIFKDGKVKVDPNPYALLNRKKPEPEKAGVVILVTEFADPKEQKKP